MRRLFAAAVAVVALGAMLAACGDDDDSSSSDTTTTEASDGSTAPTGASTGEDLELDGSRPSAGVWRVGPPGLSTIMLTLA